MNLASTSNVTENVVVPSSPVSPRSCVDCLRVLHLNAGNLYGGVETLLTTLARLRHRCPTLEPHFGICYEGRFSRELMETGAPVHGLGPVRISRPWTVWRARRRLRELLRREPFDFVICHMAWTWVVFGGTARAAGSKVVLWAHGFHNGNHWLDRMARRMIPDLAIANSRFTASKVRESFPSSSVQVIYCPVALEETPEAGRWRATLRKEQGIADGTTVILQVGRLEPWKGHLVHLRALARLPATRKWVSWIAGGPQSQEQEEYFRHLQKTAQELGIGGRVQFLGQRTDVPKLLAASDIFCQPNQGPEPFGLVFVEALWAGRPVISSALGGALEIVDESCGLLVTPDDPDSLAESLLRLIESPELRGRLGGAGAARARQLCDPARQMQSLKDILNAEIANRRNL
jgi:glycosyltransferase involved in cell wall biosynthesis